MNSGPVPDVRRTWLPAYTITIKGITTIFFSIRIYSRLKGTGGVFGLDDVFISLAWGLAMITGGFEILGALKYGFDRHIWYVEPSLWEGGALLGWVEGLLYIFASMFAKISVLLFYRRLVEGTCSRVYRAMLRAAIVFTVLFAAVSLILWCTNCLPTNAFWRRLDPTYKGQYSCISQRSSKATSAFTGGMGAFTDFYSVLLPGTLMLRVRVTKRQKVALISIFALGFLTVATAIIRTYYLVQFSGDYLDKTWLGFNVIIAGMTEIEVGIMCACAPSIRSLFRSYFADRSINGSTIGRFFSSSANRSGAGRSGRSGTGGTEALDTNNSSLGGTRTEPEMYDRYGQYTGGSSRGYSEASEWEKGRALEHVDY